MFLCPTSTCIYLCLSLSLSLIFIIMDSILPGWFLHRAKLHGYPPFKIMLHIIIIQNCSCLSVRPSVTEGHLREDASIWCYIQKSTTIAFVPPNFVRVSWDGLKAEKPDNERVESFATYIDQTWMNGHFRPRMWNYFAHSGPRKNNHLEEWHNCMKTISRKAHPNLYEILELFQREQAATEVTIQQLEAGGV